MDYWFSTMQDDVYMIVADGWAEAVKPRSIAAEGDKKSKEKADFTVGKLKYKAEFVPYGLVIARYSQKSKRPLIRCNQNLPRLNRALKNKKKNMAQKVAYLKKWQRVKATKERSHPRP